MTVTASGAVYALGGNDSVTITSARPDNGILSTIYAGTGNDTVYVTGGSANAKVFGDDGNDTLTVRLDGVFAGEVHGGAGNDFINSSGNGYGDAGDDTVFSDAEAYGGDGADHVFGDAGADGGGGDDYVDGGEGASGGAGSDEVHSFDTVSGGAGNDVLFESDNAFGGAGHDVFVSAVPTDGPDIIPVDFKPGEDRFATTIPLTVVSAFTGHAREVLDTDPTGGSGFAVDLDGDGAEDTALYLSTPTNTLLQSDLLCAAHLTDKADDISLGESSAELMLGRDGNDVLKGAGGDDWLFGGFGNDSLSGGTGNDLLVGNSGDDVLSGGVGNDLFVGGEGTDYVYGGAGDDIIDGGTGKDVLSGGTGNDIFVFNVGDSGIGGVNRDVIKDFEIGIDKIDISGFAEHAFAALGQNVLLLLDANGDGTYDMQVNVGFATPGGTTGFGNGDLILA